MAAPISYVYTTHAYLRQGSCVVVCWCHDADDGDPVDAAVFWRRRESGSKHDHDSLSGARLESNRGHVYLTSVDRAVFSVVSSSAANVPVVMY